MCVVSMVYDDFNKRFPNIIPDPEPYIPVSGSITIATADQYEYVSKKEIEDLRKVIREATKFIENFKQAVQAAKIVDRLTNQPDCEDPEKKKLEEKVAKLEQEIKSINNKLKKQSSKKKPAVVRKKNTK